VTSVGLDIAMSVASSGHLNKYPDTDETYTYSSPNRHRCGKLGRRGHLLVTDRCQESSDSVSGYPYSYLNRHHCGKLGCPGDLF
jgi:hypothetical protein